MLSRKSGISYAEQRRLFRDPPLAHPDLSAMLGSRWSSGSCEGEELFANA